MYLLTGPRTCSASELVINGLRPFVDVVVVGDTSCGKPVGFVPVSRCDTTFNVVNFEAVNADNQGRYFGGIEPRCAVEENLSQPVVVRRVACCLRTPRGYLPYGTFQVGRTHEVSSRRNTLT